MLKRTVTIPLLAVNLKKATIPAFAMASAAVYYCFTTQAKVDPGGVINYILKKKTIKIPTLSSLRITGVLCYFRACLAEICDIVVDTLLLLKVYLPGKSTGIQALL